MTKSFEPLEEFEIVFNSGFTKLASTFRKNNVEGEKVYFASRYACHERNLGR